MQNQELSWTSPVALSDLTELPPPQPYDLLNDPFRSFDITVIPARTLSLHRPHSDTCDIVCLLD
jgi:hypothetical protein